MKYQGLTTKQYERVCQIAKLAGKTVDDIVDDIIDWVEEDVYTTEECIADWEDTLRIEVNA